MKKLCLLLILWTSTPIFAQSLNQALIAQIVKDALENIHFRRKKIDDTTSERAYKIFIESLDPRKQFFTQEDINKLDQFKYMIDDEIASGKFSLLERAQAILRKNQVLVRKFVSETLKKPLPYAETFSYETNPQKRSYAKNFEELKKRWIAILKLEIYGDYIGEVNKKNAAEEQKKKVNKVVLQKITSMSFEQEKKSRQEISEINSEYFKRLEQQSANDRFSLYINALTTSRDPHTIYLPPEKKEEFDIDISGHLNGIGALLRDDKGVIKVVRIIPGSAAAKKAKTTPDQALEPEDSILKVAQDEEKDFVNITGMKINDAVKLIRGPRGTKVRLEIEKSDKRKMVISIIRDIVKIEETYAKSQVIENNGKYGYLNLPKFYRDFAKEDNGRNCSEDVAKEIEKLKKRKVKGIIFDLRNNGGGALEDARKTAGLFIEQGPIVQVRDYNNKVEVLKDDDRKTFYDGPLVVLVNKFSASASEIFAGALQDYGRAIIIGDDHTHGKGTVQVVINLGQGLLQKLFNHVQLGALKLTIQQFYRINGESTQLKGISPHIILPDRYQYIESHEKELDHALPWDKIAPLTYKKSKIKNLKKLMALSKKRVESSSGFALIRQANQLIIEKSKQTTTPTDFSSYLKKYLENKKSLESRDKLEEKYTVSYKFIDQKNQTISFETDKDKKKNRENKFYWLEEHSKDPYIEEALNVLHDMSP